MVNLTVLSNTVLFNFINFVFNVTMLLILIEYSNNIISDFVKGFKITDEIKEKVDKTKD